MLQAMVGVNLGERSKETSEVGAFGLRETIDISTVTKLTASTKLDSRRQFAARC